MQLCNQNIDNFDLYYFLENEKQANKQTNTKIILNQHDQKFTKMCCTQSKYNFVCQDIH